GGPGGDEAAGGRGDVRVVVHQPASGRTGPDLIGGERASVLAEQVGQEGAAGRGLGGQVGGVKLVERVTGAVETGGGQRGGGRGVDVRAGGQAEPAEQPLPGRGQVLIGQVERGGDRQVLGAHDAQPVARRRQAGGQLGGGPGRVMAQLPGEHPDRQRQVPA